MKHTLILLAALILTPLAAFAQAQPDVANATQAAKRTWKSVPAEKKWVWADARIDGDTVLVSSGYVAEPVAVRYGGAYKPMCNFYDNADLPASPFRTDDDVPSTAP